MSDGFLLEADDLAVHFKVRDGRGRRQLLRAVDGVSFRIRPGETLGLVGESGSGKSTVGRALIGLEPAASGHVRFRGQELGSFKQAEARRVRRELQIVFQDPWASLNPRMTIGRSLIEPMRAHGLHRGRERERAEQLLDQVGLPATVLARHPHQFSGGQLQRIGIARALATDPAFLVCDEPTSALDVSIQAQIINLLRDIQAETGISMLFIAHDLAVVRNIADRVAVMYLGRLVERSTGDRLYSEPSHPYTRALLASVPTPDPELERRREHVGLAGETPSPLDPPVGCRFQTRCPYVEDRCRREEPPLEALRDGHDVACFRWPEVLADAADVIPLDDATVRANEAMSSRGARSHAEAGADGDGGGPVADDHREHDGGDPDDRSDDPDDRSDDPDDRPTSGGTRP